LVNQLLIEKIVKGISRFSQSGRTNSEENTKKKIIEPLLEMLGWDFLSAEVQLEYPIRVGTRTVHVDYALILEDKPVVLVEAKPFDDPLSDSEAEQIISYGRFEEVKWAVLTNGRVLKIFNTEEGRTEKESLFVEINLENLPQQIGELYLLSRESVLTGEIENAAKRMAATMKSMRNLRQRQDELVEEFKKILIRITGTEDVSHVENVATQLLKRTIELFETHADRGPPPTVAEIPLISRKELQTLPPGELIICPSRTEGVEFLKKYNAWGFVNIGKSQKPKYFALYVGVPESSVLYFGEIESITQPLESKDELKRIQEEDTDTFVRGKRVIHLKSNTLVTFIDPIPIKTRRSGLRGIKYTTLEKLVNADNTDDL